MRMKTCREEEHLNVTPNMHDWMYHKFGELGAITVVCQNFIEISYTKAKQ